MNLQHIVQEIEKTDPELYDRVDTRRGVMQQFRTISGKIALAALPLALGGLFKKAYGRQTGSGNILGVLNYALTLEYLESEFYIKAIESGVVPAGTPAEGAIKTIRDHEVAHVAFLKKAIMAMGGTAVAKPTFDFTAGGAFGNVFTNYDTFLAVAQTFEDTGVRAYKGKAGELMSNNDVLTAALQIHSSEARHAAHIRYMRKARGADVKPWITGKNSGIGSAVQASYDGEELTTQAGVNIAQIVSADAASESFDEPLTEQQVLAIVDPFIV